MWQGNARTKPRTIPIGSLVSMPFSVDARWVVVAKRDGWGGLTYTLHHPHSHAEHVVKRTLIEEGVEQGLVLVDSSNPAFYLEMCTSPPLQVAVQEKEGPTPLGREEVIRVNIRRCADCTHKPGTKCSGPEDEGGRK